MQSGNVQLMQNIRGALLVSVASRVSLSIPSTSHELTTKQSFCPITVISMNTITQWNVT
jgi:hypothetical protein